VYAGEGTQGDDLNHAGVRGVVNAVLERCLKTMEKDKGKPRTLPARNGVELGWAAFLQSLEDLDSTTNISLIFLDNAWEQAERLSSVSSSSKPISTDILISNNRKSGSKSAPVYPTMLTEFELDTVRFVLAGLLNKCIDEYSHRDGKGKDAPRDCAAHPSGDWTDVLDLQDNTLAHIQAKPYMLASQVRVWVFIKFVVHSILRESGHLRDRTRQLVLLLKKSVDTPHETRALLGREHGNVFGIWDMAPEGTDSEMLGWGLYSLGSYFNHGMS
jgi:SET and MYND domain-containing protein